MAHGDSLAQTIEATQRSLEERLRAALLPHRDPDRPRDNYRDIDTFTAATSRHLAAIEAVLVEPVRHAVPDGEEFGREYVKVARRLEHTLALIKGRLYGEAHAVHLEWHELWETARAELDQHNWIERRMVDLLIKHGDPVELDELAQRVFEAETRGPTRPHPKTPHTGILGLVARRIWALADRFWDAAEGRVIPDPVRPAPHRHDSLISQYLVADPKFDRDATIMDHHHRHPHRRKAG
jgi:hypothetical protein